MLFILILLGMEKSSALQCIASIPTIRYVQSCPNDKDSWKAAAYKKKCHHIADIQRCTEPTKFKYHCLLNNFRNATVEVCAPTRYAQGFCSNFNAQQSEVGEDHDADCTTYKNPCPRRYLSNETFMYQLCYKSFEQDSKKIDEHKEIFPKNYTVLKNTSSTTIENVHSSGDTEITPWITAVTVLSIFLLIVIAACFFCYNVRKQCMRRKGSRHLNRKHQKGNTEENYRLMEQGHKWHRDFLPFTLHLKNPQQNVGECDVCILERMAEENETTSMTYLETAKEDDQYFEETIVYEKIKSIFSKHKIVILTGPSGFGKTKTAIHLILRCMQSLDETWVFRKINFYTELSYIERLKNTLIFIDDIFDGNEAFISSWMKLLDKVYIHVRGMADKTNTLGMVNVIITSRGNAVDEACKLIKKRSRSIFQEEFVINMGDPSYSLNNGAKEKILKKKFQHAEKKKGMTPPELSDEFWTEIYQANAHIGFPLCAHLFAFENEYRENGAEFFKCPTLLVSKQIQEVVEKDKTHRTKTLFFLLLLQTIKKCKVDITCEKKIEKFLQKECKLRNNFEPFNFTNLGDTASFLMWSFVKKEHNGIYQFIHESVFISIEKFFFQTMPVPSFSFFPLDAINRQTQDTSWMTEKIFEYIAHRLIEDVQDGKAADVCECEILKTKDFSKILLASLTSHRKRITKDFLTKKSLRQPCLPVTFWLGRNAVVQMSENLSDFIDAQEGERVITENHLYLGLYGEILQQSEVDLPRETHTDNIYSIIKIKVLHFKDDKGNTVIHYLVSSKHKDEYIAKIIRKIMQDSKTALHVNVKNNSGETAIMRAVRCKEIRKNVIVELMKGGCDINLIDHSQFTVLHHCVSAEVDDIICANRIEAILEKSENVELGNKNTAGQTALNLACMNKMHSRIKTICCLLRYGDYKNYINIVDLNGYSAIFNTVSELRGTDELVKLERLLRVCILLLYGCQPQIKNKSNETAVDVCSRNGYNDLVSIIEEYPSQDEMINILNDQSREVSALYTPKDDIKIDITYNDKVKEEIMQAIKNAVKYLAKNSLRKP